LLDPSLFHLIGPTLHKASFPSGHSITVFAGAAALVVCLLAARRRRWEAPRMLAGLIVLVAILAGVSRVAVGAHWPVDVLAGAGAGWLAGTIGAWLTFRVPRLWQTPRYATIMAITLGITGLWLLNAPSDYPLGNVTIYIAAACSLLSVADLVLRVGVER
jgi:membrane-associated phospholipid phosphatase